MKLRILEPKRSKLTLLIWFLISFSVISTLIYLNRSKNLICLSQHNINEENNSNFPLELYDGCNLTPPKLFIGKKCTKFPGLHQINFDNINWQKIVLNGVDLYLLSAFYDDSEIIPIIKVIGTSNRAFESNVMCQIWFKNHGGVVEGVKSDVNKNVSVSTKLDESYRFFVINCEVPEIFDDKLPHSVSLVDYECSKPDNLLRINYNREKELFNKFNWGICSFGVLLDPKINDFIHFIEHIKDLSAQKVVFYTIFEINREFNDVFEVYDDFVDVVRINLPGNLPKLGIFFDEDDGVINNFKLGLFQDCFYKNMNRFNEISFLEFN